MQCTDNSDSLVLSKEQLLGVRYSSIYWLENYFQRIGKTYIDKLLLGEWNRHKCVTFNLVVPESRWIKCLSIQISAVAYLSENICHYI